MTREPGSSALSIFRWAFIFFFWGSTISTYIRPMKTTISRSISMRIT